MTLSKFDQMGRDLERIDGLHSCDPQEWTARAVGGDPYNGAGTSVWGCPTCLPMKLEAIGRYFSDARIEGKAPMIPLGEWSCNICGPSPTSRGNWCDRGCGRDYNQMTWVPADVRVLGLDQPWATLWVLGIKRIETRGAPWPSTIPLQPNGAWVIVHANLRPPTQGIVGRYGVIPSGPTHGFIFEVSISTTEGRLESSIPLPLGAVVGAVHVTDSLPIVDINEADYTPGPHLVACQRLLRWHGRESIADLSDQLPYGDFTPGRFGYLSDEFHALTEPIPHRGKQGWSDRATPELIATVNAQIWKSDG